MVATHASFVPHKLDEAGAVAVAIAHTVAKYYLSKPSRSARWQRRRAVGLRRRRRQLDVAAMTGELVHRIAMPPLTTCVVAEDAGLAVAGAGDELWVIDLRYGRIRTTARVPHAVAELTSGLHGVHGELRSNGAFSFIERLPTAAASGRESRGVADRRARALPGVGPVG